MISAISTLLFVLHVEVPRFRACFAISPLLEIQARDPLLHKEALQYVMEPDLGIRFGLNVLDNMKT
jgi:hypothetical protein